MSDYGGGFQFTFGTAEGQPHHQPQPYQPTQAHDASSVYVSRGGAVTYPTLPQQPQQQPQELVNITYSDQQYNPPAAPRHGGGNAHSGDTVAVARTSPSPARGSAGGSPRYKVTFKGEFGETQDVFCEIGMDGLKLVDTHNGSCLETFPLNVISRWAVRDKDTFLFWSSGDGKQRQVELRGASKDVSDILDTITAACMQLCEMMEKEEHQRKVQGLGDEDDDKEGETEASSSGGDKKGIVGWIAGKVKTGQGDDAEDSASIPEGVEYWKQPDYDGWMQSQGEHIKTWRKRWFVLKDGYLFRFLNDKVLPQSKPRGVISLASCLEIAKPSKDSSQGATIQVTTHKKSKSASKGDTILNVLLVADSKAERDLWLEILLAAKKELAKNERDAAKKKETEARTSKARERETKSKEWMAELDEGFRTLQRNKKPSAQPKPQQQSTVEVLDYTSSSSGYSPSAPRSGYQPQASYDAGHHYAQQQHAAPPQQQPQQQPQSALANWKVCYSPDGRVYYYNPQTGVTQWEA